MRIPFLSLLSIARVYGYNPLPVPSCDRPTSRRVVFQQSWAAAAFLGATTASTAFITSPSPAFAANASTSLYNDPLHGFSIQVPSDWIPSIQRLPDRRQMQVWKDPSDDQTLLFIAFTPVRDDFTSLGSFGSVEAVAEQTILPKGELAGTDSNGITSRLISAKSEKQAYYFDYTQTVPGVTEETHYRTIFALAQGATGGAGAVLVTATLQTTEANYSKLQPLIDQVIASYGKSKE
jgi:hypothetical protein